MKDKTQLVYQYTETTPCFTSLSSAFLQCVEFQELSTQGADVFHVSVILVPELQSRPGQTGVPVLCDNVDDSMWLVKANREPPLQLPSNGTVLLSSGFSNNVAAFANEVTGNVFSMDPGSFDSNMAHSDTVRWCCLQKATLNCWKERAVVYAVLCVRPVKTLAPLAVRKEGLYALVQLNGEDFCISGLKNLPTLESDQTPRVLQMAVEDKNAAYSVVLSPFKMFEFAKNKMFMTSKKFKDMVDKLKVSNQSMEKLKTFATEFQLTKKQRIAADHAEKTREIINTITTGRVICTLTCTPQMPLMLDNSLPPAKLFKFEENAHLADVCKLDLKKINFREFVGYIANPLLLETVSPGDGSMSTSQMLNCEFTALFTMAYTLFVGTECGDSAFLEEYMLAFVRSDLYSILTEEEKSSVEEFKVQSMEYSAVCQFLLYSLLYLQEKVFGEHFADFKIRINPAMFTATLISMDTAALLDLTRNVVHRLNNGAQYTPTAIAAVTHDHLQSLVCQSYLLLRFDDPVSWPDIGDKWAEIMAENSIEQTFDAAKTFFVARLTGTGEAQ